MVKWTGERNIVHYSLNWENVTRLKRGAQTHRIYSIRSFYYLLLLIHMWPKKEYDFNVWPVVSKFNFWVTWPCEGQSCSTVLAILHSLVTTFIDSALTWFGNLCMKHMILTEYTLDVKGGSKQNKIRESPLTGVVQRRKKYLM